MVAPTRAPRTRASGGRTLMLLGVLLALAAGTIVIYIVSQATTTTSQMVTVVMAKQNITSGTILSLSPTDPTKNNLDITDAFVAKQVSVDYAPADYLPFTTQDQLNIKLNNEVVVGTYYTGDILRTGDFTSRLAALGTGAAGSLTNINPGELKPGDVLVEVALTSETAGGGGAGNGKTSPQPGDHVDFIVVDCNVSGGCEAQTTLQNMYVYAASGNALFVVASHQQAVELVYIMHSLSLQVVIRKPGDTNTITTTPVSNATIIKEFGF
jgi:hypothetical protein